MQMMMCAMYDRKAGVYEPPLAFRHLPDALRYFCTVMKEDNRYSSFAADYDFYRVGYFDDAVGEFKFPDGLPLFLHSGASVAGMLEEAGVTDRGVVQ